MGGGGGAIAAEASSPANISAAFSKLGALSDVSDAGLGGSGAAAVAAAAAVSAPSAATGVPSLSGGGITCTIMPHRGQATICPTRAASRTDSRARQLTQVTLNNSMERVGLRQEVDGQRYVALWGEDSGESDPGVLPTADHLGPLLPSITDQRFLPRNGAASRSPRFSAAVRVVTIIRPGPAESPG